MPLPYSASYTTRFPIINLLMFCTIFLSAMTVAQPALSELARRVDRTESVRAVKTLQYSYAQYPQYGLWNEVGALFTADGKFVFDGMIQPAQTATGPDAIATLLRKRYGGGSEGLLADSLSSMMIDSPVVNLSADGESAKARWQTIIFHGHAGQARIEGGIFENQYERDADVWKIATVRYFPQYDGPYEEGWVNWGGGDLPVVPKHFDVDSAGTPIPPATGTAPETSTTLAELQSRIDTLNDEDRIRNLQSAFGYYVDRKMWDDVVDLFADDSAVEISGQGIWRGPAGVRRRLESIGAPKLAHGQLNDRLQNDVTVTIAPGGNEAFARGIELGMLGEADQELGWWEVAVFRNRFIKEGGVWKLRELRRVVLMKTDIFQGWGKSRLVDPVPTGSHAPDAPVAEADSAAPGLAMPAFLDVHPVTGQAIVPAGSVKLVAITNLTEAIAPDVPAPITADEPAAVSRDLRRMTASRTSRRLMATMSTTPMQPVGRG